MKIIYKLKSFLFTIICLKKVEHGTKSKCNGFCRFSINTVVGNNCHFNGINISGEGKVVIGDNFHSGRKCRIITTFHNFDRGTELPYDNTYYSRDVIIEDNVWIDESVLILGGVTIGEGSVIQAGSVVCKSVPPLAIAGGHPAVPFKYRNSEHYYSIKNRT